MSRSSRRISPQLLILSGPLLLLFGCGSESASPNNATTLPGGAVGGASSTSGAVGGAGTNGSTAGNAGLVGGSGNGGGNNGGNSGSGITTSVTGKATLATNQTMTTCEAPGLAAGTQRIEAECAFGAAIGNCQGVSGGQQGTQTENAGTTVGFIEGGDALWYSGVTLDGMKSLKVHYAKGVAGGSVEVRLDSTTGTLLGTLTPNTTTDWTTWADATVALNAATGTHVLYLVATGSTAGILSLDWLELSAGTGTTSAGASAFHLNHLGFDTQGAKHAVVEGPATLPQFSVVDASGTAVWCGTLTPLSFTAWGGSNSFYSVDFTELTRPGTYRLQIGSSASTPFVIGDTRLFSQTASGVLGYFKSSRADDADVVAKDSSLTVNGQTKDVHGGWYDASGDISKYLTHLSYANYLNPQQIPLVAWALAYTYAKGGTALTASGQATAVQAEALWGADYLLRVLDPTGFFYTNVFDSWTGEISSRQICAFEGTGTSLSITNEYQSAMREGGGMSIAALARAASLKANGAFTSAQYLEGAEKAFLHLNTSGVNYADDKKENVIDDYTGLLAAAELYATTQTATYLTAARARATSLIGRLSPTGYFIADGASRPFWHASDAGLPVVALARYVEVETDEAQKTAARQAIRSHLSYLVQVTQAVTNPYGYARQHTSATASGFFIPHNNETGYWWQGENARLGSLAAAALIGAESLGASGTEYLGYLRYAGYQLDWILGNNPYDICFMKGFGKNNPEAYSGEKPQNGTWPGGIVNGITGNATDGSGIQWLGASAAAPWDNWRWNEQWLPHSAWYLVAVTALVR